MSPFDLSANSSSSVPALLTGPRVEEAMWRSVRWLDRCIAFHEASGKSKTQNLFAIVQGGLDARLRGLCLDEMVKRKDHVPGYAVGGLSGGEEKGTLSYPCISSSYWSWQQQISFGGCEGAHSSCLPTSLTWYRVKQCTEKLPEDRKPFVRFQRHPCLQAV